MTAKKSNKKLAKLKAIRKNHKAEADAVAEEQRLGDEARLVRAGFYAAAARQANGLPAQEGDDEKIEAGLAAGLAVEDVSPDGGPVIATDEAVAATLPAPAPDEEEEPIEPPSVAEAVAAEPINVESLDEQPSPTAEDAAVGGVEQPSVIIAQGEDLAESEQK